MNLLILSFYFQPDLCAGSFRTTALVKALLAQLPDDAQIELITTLPNRYSTFVSEAPAVEESLRLTTHRIALPVHQSGMLDQSRSFIAYAQGVMQVIKGKKYDVVYATSSRLMTAALGALVARRGKFPLYLDIRDIFVDTIKDVLPKKLTWFIDPLFSFIEHLTLKSAKKVNLVSAGFLPYFQERYPEQKFSTFTNGIDEEFLQVLPVVKTVSTREVLNVVYAGNIGEGQGLHTVIPALAKHFEGRLHFQLIGDGGRRRQLESAISSAGCRNVELLAPVKRETLIEAYKNADVLFLHLNDYEAFKKVLPSKIFEYAALGKPVWAGVAGYAADFVKFNISNAAVFAPCDDQKAAESFENLSMVTEPRVSFVESFSREKIMIKMAADIIAVAGGS